MRRREFIAALGSALSVFLCLGAAAQDGYHGVGHDKWHQDFYAALRRNDGGGPCCGMVGDHYEVKVDGEWVPVPNDKINNVVAPDRGTHVCAPRQEGRNKGVLYCVILPSES